MASKITLFDSPQVNPSIAPIENVLELTPVVDIGPVSANLQSNQPDEKNTVG